MATDALTSAGSFEITATVLDGRCLQKSDFALAYCHAHWHRLCCSKYRSAGLNGPGSSSGVRPAL